MGRANATIGVREAARKLNVTTKYVYDLLYSGKLEATKVAKQWRIQLTAVKERLRERGM